MSADTLVAVPSADGISHNEVESAEPKYIETGANALLHATLQLTYGVE